MNAPSSHRPDLDNIARNLSDLAHAHLTPAESAAYEHELSAIAFYFPPQIHGYRSAQLTAIPLTP